MAKIEDEDIRRARQARDVAKALQADTTPTPQPFTQPMTIAGQTPPPATTVVDPMRNKAVMPTDAPAGYHYTWIGGTTTGSWKLYKDAPGATPTGGGVTGGTTAVTPSATTTADATAKLFAEQTAAATAAANIEKTKSAYNLIKQEFESRGLGALIPELQTIMQQGLTDSNEIRLYLQGTQAYKTRFIANEERLKKGLTALTPAQYVNMEDQYQEIMRRYGLPSKYYSKNDIGVQEGFNKLIANDVSSTELEDRVMTAQNRLINADPNVMDALRKFYPNITKGDLLAYTLDPENTIGDIKRKVTAAEIGGAAMAEGLNMGTTPEEIAAYAARANELASYGVTKAQARQGYATIAGMLPTTSKLADIYQSQQLGPYTQATAEAEIFGTVGSAEAERRRKKLAQLEQASFSGSSGLASGALSRDRAGGYQGYRQPGAGEF